MSSIELLQKLLAEEQTYTELLNRLDQFAQAQSSYEYGLPLYDNNLEHMRLMVKEWICKLILKVGEQS